MYPSVRSSFTLAWTLPLAFCAVAAQPPLDPLETLNRINHNYNTLKDACQEPDTGAARGHYYCSGVTLRMVNDGPFNPWDYSPYAIKIGATSYSWIRGPEHPDSHSPGRFHPAHPNRRGGLEPAGQGAGLDLHLRLRWRYRAGAQVVRLRLLRQPRATACGPGCDEQP